MAVDDEYWLKTNLKHDVEVMGCCSCDRNQPKNEVYTEQKKKREIIFGWILEYLKLLK